jgi:ABC-2 type transport system ATP-binding protein
MRDDALVFEASVAESDGRLITMCREERYWSRFASSYDRDGEYVVGEAILQAIEEQLSNEQPLGDAIELGCGTGYFTKAIARSARHVTATDISGQMLAVARTELSDYRNVTVQKTDCAHTSFAAEGFDSVVMVNLVHVLDEPLPCLREGHRILRSGGLLLVVDFTGCQMPWARKMKLGLRYLRKWGLPPRGGRHDMGPKELASLVESAGFTVDEVELLIGEANALYLRARKE